MLKRLSTMFRPLDSLLIILLLVAASYTYNIKHQADLVDKNISKIYSQMRAEKEKIDLLEADWALLNQVARLESLVERYNGQLQLQPLDAKQIISLNQLPPKKLNHTPALDDIDAAGGDIGVDQVTTGAVAPQTNASSETIIDDVIAEEIITNDAIISDGGASSVGNNLVDDIAAELFDEASNGIVESDFSNENGSN